MTFTYNAALSNDISWVRFHIADTDSDGYYLADETINYLIGANSKEQAVIDCIENIILQLSTPNTRIDWLSVDYTEARKGYEKLLETMKQKLGITGGATLTTVTHTPWRADSNQTDGDYT